MHQCPFCHGPIDGVPVEVDLTAKQKAVFSMIVNAGPGGIGIDEVMDTFFRGRSPTTLRTHICNINRAIHPLHIERHGDVFRFVLNKIEITINQEKAEAPG